MYVHVHVLHLRSVDSLTNALPMLLHPAEPYARRMIATATEGLIDSCSTVHMWECKGIHGPGGNRKRTKEVISRTRPAATLNGGHDSCKRIQGEDGQGERERSKAFQVQTKARKTPPEAGDRRQAIKRRSTPARKTATMSWNGAAEEHTLRGGGFGIRETLKKAGML